MTIVATRRRRHLDLIVASLCAVAIIAVIVNFVARCAAAIIVVVIFARRNQTPHFGLGIPVLVWGSPDQNGDPQTEMGMQITRIPNPIRGSPNRNGDQDIPIPKRGSPNRFGDCSVTN